MMRRLLLATNNAGKVAELRALLAPLDAEIVTPGDLGLALSPEEDGATYVENAAIKARAFAAAASILALADDSGIELEALDGRPGVRSARYGPPGGSDADRVQALLDEMRAVPDDRRAARFVAVVAVALPSGRLWSAEGELRGALTHAPRGTSGFGYDPIFLLPDLGRTVAELTDVEKNERSHRARAVRAVLPSLRAALGAFYGGETADARQGDDRGAGPGVQPVRPGDAATTAPQGVTASGAPIALRSAAGSRAPAARLSHLDAEGRAHMVDVSAKDDTAREATARGTVLMQPATLALILAGEIAKGNVLTTAQIAGVMAAKRTHELIPLCHPLLLTGIDVTLTPDEAAAAIAIEATVRTTGKTGVEMEALTAATVAGLTIYDMCKAVDRGMRLTDVRLARKHGGKSGAIVLE